MPALPVFSHGHFQYHCTYGHSAKKGAVPNNIKNYNDLVGRPAGGHAYFKPSFCHWPKGGYTRKEANHAHRNPDEKRLDVDPQCFEFGQFYLPDDVGLKPRHRNTDLSVMGSKCSLLTKEALQDWLTETAFINTNTTTRPTEKNGEAGRMRASMRARPGSAPPPSARSDKTDSTLAIGTFSLTKGNAFVANPKPAAWSSPWFATGYPPRPKTVDPNKGRKREEEARALLQWEKEEARQTEVANHKPIPYPGAKLEQSDLLEARLTALDAFRAGLMRGETLDPATGKARPGTAGRKPMQEKAMGDPMVSGRTQRVRPSSAHPRLQHLGF
jgi:hypothetical protein